MTLSMEQFRERLVDYLYDELDGEARREFEACLVESAECRRELAAFERTLRTARLGLLPVDREAPPARVRTALLAAAQQAKHVREPRPVAGPRRAGKERASAWHWLRTPWLVPTFSVAAAVAILVLGRRIEPLRSHPPEVHETPAHEAPSSTKGFAVPPPEWPAGRAVQPAAESSAEELAGAESSKKRASSPETRRASRAVATGSVDARESEAAPVPTHQVARDDARGVGAGPLAQGAPPAAAPRRAAPSAAARARSASESADEARPVETAAPAPAAAAALTLDALLRRAQEHLAARRFRETASDYRELLRRYPTDARVPAWRKLLALALEAARDGGAPR